MYVWLPNASVNGFSRVETGRNAFRQSTFALTKSLPIRCCLKFHTHSTPDSRCQRYMRLIASESSELLVLSMQTVSPVPNSRTLLGGGGMILTWSCGQAQPRL